MLHQKNIPINFISFFNDDDRLARRPRAQYGKCGIELNALNPLEENIQALVHELCHMAQQDKIGEAWDEPRNSTDQILFSRLIEGDANARTAVIVRKINEKIDKKFPIRYRRNILPLGWKGLKNLLRGEKSSDAEIADCVFKNYQKSLYACLHYDGNGYFLGGDYGHLPRQMLSEKFSRISSVIDIGDIKPNTSYMGIKNMEEMLDNLCVYVPRCYIRGRKY